MNVGSFAHNGWAVKAIHNRFEVSNVGNTDGAEGVKSAEARVPGWKTTVGNGDARSEGSVPTELLRAPEIHGRQDVSELDRTGPDFSRASSEWGASFEFAPVVELIMGDRLDEATADRELIRGEGGIYDEAGHIKRIPFVLDGLEAELEATSPPPMVSRGYPPIYPPILGQGEEQSLNTDLSKQVPPSFAWESDNMPSNDFVGVEDGVPPKIHVDFHA